MTDYFVFQNSYLYNEAKVSLDHYTIVEADKTWMVYNWLQYFTLDNITKELKNNGFKVNQVFSDVAGKPYDEKMNTLAIIASLSD